MKDIATMYEALKKKNDGCTFFKMDLHVHTPASRCYDPKSRSDDGEYLKILDTALLADIRILAITDHNTFRGYFKMREILDELKNNDKQAYRKYGGLLVLPGVEISNFGKHTLAIFPDSAERDNLNRFLGNIGIEDVNSGDTKNDAYLVTPTVLLQEIDNAGGLAILAHVDARDGLLRDLLTDEHDEGPWLQKGRSVASVIQSQYLSGVSLNDHNLRPKLEDLLKKDAYRRNGPPLAIIACSDSHSSDPKTSPNGLPLGSRFSYVKLSEPSWEGLRLALLDPEVRVFGAPPEANHPYIVGVSIQGQYLGGAGGEAQIFPFNSSLNCVIGARGTGKSTLLDVIQYTLYQDRSEKTITSRFDAAAVFVRWKETTYALTCETKPETDGYTGAIRADRGRRGLFRMTRNGRFVAVEKERRDAITRSLVSSAYGQRVVFDLGNRFDGPLPVIDEFLAVEKPGEFGKVFADVKSATDDLTSAISALQEAKDSGRRILDKEVKDVGKFFTAKREALARRTALRTDLVERMSQYLNGQVKFNLLSRLNPSAYKRFVDGVVYQSRRLHNDTYEKQRDLRALLERVAHPSTVWSFPAAILTGDWKAVATATGVGQDKAQQIIAQLKPVVMNMLDLLDIFPDDIVDFEYNVNDGSGKKPLFRSRDLLSMGQKSVAVLLMIMKVGREIGDTRPLIIDQPEDDLDNMYIYSSLVGEIRQSKNVRQMIFSTHNANIPISADAEQILILRPSANGERGEVARTGSIDKKSMIADVEAILEGGPEAFRRRATKYQGAEE